MFVLDFDNAIFHFWLPEEVRSQVEATGRAIVGADERKLLSFTKQLHAIAVAMVIPTVTIMIYWTMISSNDISKWHPASKMSRHVAYIILKHDAERTSVLPYVTEHHASLQ